MLAQNIVVGTCNKYPQPIFWIKNKTKICIPCKPQFYYIKMGYEAVYITWECYRDVPFLRNTANTTITF